MNTIETLLNADVIARLMQRPEPKIELPMHGLGKTVAVTGAGGFIGSHLVDALLTRGYRVVMIDSSEYNLYRAHQTHEDVGACVPILGNYGDENLMSDVLSSFSVDTVIHAGAYKHVPMCERNPVAAVQNNVLAANTLFDSCGIANVKKVVLVSTDKAVRPTNVMGATKQAVEHLLISSGLDYRIVRFGNVLWSSGSVLPLWLRQMRSGQLATLTDEHITRFFMSVQEAVCLILQSVALETGTYVFDMGKPVIMRDLLLSLYRELGLPKKEPNQIYRVTGLRPGEKRYEELTLGEGLVTTLHSRIGRAQEPAMGAQKVERMMGTLAYWCRRGDAMGVRRALQTSLKEYKVAVNVDDLTIRKLEDCFRDSSPQEQ